MENVEVFLDTKIPERHPLDNLVDDDEQINSHLLLAKTHLINNDGVVKSREHCNMHEDEEFLLNVLKGFHNRDLQEGQKVPKTFENHSSSLRSTAFPWLRKK